MSPDAAGQLTATGVALVLAALDRDALPAASYLSARAVCSLARLSLVGAVLAPARAGMPEGAPFSSPLALAAVYLDGAAWLAGGPAALAALAVAVFAERPRRWLAVVGAAWGVASVAVALGYPATRGAVLARCYLAAALVSLLASLAAVVRWSWRRAEPRVSHVVAIVAVAVSLAEHVAPVGQWAKGDPFTVGASQEAHAIFFAVIAVYLVMEVASCLSSSSPS